MEYKVVNSIINDLRSYSGLREGWDSIDSDTKQEIIYTWANIVETFTNDLLQSLVDKYQKEADGCDVDGIMESIAGSIREWHVQQAYLGVCKDINELIHGPKSPSTR